VQYFIDERGLPTTRDEAVGAVMATVSVGERPDSLLNLPRADEVAMRDKLHGELANVKAQIVEAQKANQTTTLAHLLSRQESIQSKLAFLEQQLAAGGGLKQSFIGGPAVGSPGSPSGPGTFGSGFLLFNQQQNVITGVTPSR
jgi:hypothetical protein